MRGRLIGGLVVVLWLGCWGKTPLPSQTPRHNEKRAVRETTAMESLFVVRVEQDGLRCDLRGHVLKAGVHDGITYPCDHLVVTYTLENQAAVPCYVFNRGHSNARSTLGYVEQRPDGVVELSQKAFLPPPDCPPTYAPVLPRVSVLKPGERQTESVYFELPLKAHTPFDFCFSESEMAPLTGSQMEFRLGYLRADEAGGEDGVPMPAQVRENDTLPAALARRQRFLSSGLQALPSGAVRPVAPWS
jgi:hypothetical protein